MPRAIQLLLPQPPAEARPNLPPDVVDELKELLIAQLLSAVLRRTEESDDE
jgi:hypothetical protein